MSIVKYNRAAVPAVFRDEFRSLFDADRIFDQVFGPEFSKSFGVDFLEKQA